MESHTERRSLVLKILWYSITILTGRVHGKMQECGKALADAIKVVAKNHKWEWGTDKIGKFEEY